MSDLDYNNIRKLDGGLLIVFRELLLRRRTTEVAKAMGLSQSAISHALARLRDLFGDPLFIRQPHGFEPTTRAIALGPQVEALLERAASTLAGPEEFDPEATRRRFRIAWSADVESVFGGALAEIFGRSAPNTFFASLGLILQPALESVLKGDADLAIGLFDRIPTGLVAKTLYRDRYCVVARQGHPEIQGKLDLETYARVGHIFYNTPTGLRTEQLIFDKAQSDKVFGTVPDPAMIRTTAHAQSWSTAILMASQSDAIVDCPERLAVRYRDQLGLQVFKTPYPWPEYDVQLVRRDDRDDGVNWLAEQLEVLAKQ